MSTIIIRHGISKEEETNVPSVKILRSPQKYTEVQCIGGLEYDFCTSGLSSC